MGAQLQAFPHARFFFPVLLLLLCLSIWLSAHPALAQAPASAEGGVIYLLPLETSINPVTKDYIVRQLAAAERAGALAVIIQLDTPGGLESSMKEIVKAIFAAKIPVIVWVGPAGSRAGSAGVFITLAADIAAMANGTNIGAAHPVGLGGESPEKQSPMEEKITNDAAAFARSIAEKRGRNVSWAEQAVRKSVSITATAALKQDVIDLIADSVGELLQKLDNYPLGAREARWGIENLLANYHDQLAQLDPQAPDELQQIADRLAAALVARDADQAFAVADQAVSVLRTLSDKLSSGQDKLRQAIQETRERVKQFIVNKRILHTAGATIREVPMSLKERLLNYLADPNIVYILLMIGLYALIYEFFNPGIGFGLVAGGLSLLLAFMGLQILPINVTGLALILFGVLLMVLDAFTPTHGILTTGGVISLLLGSFTLFNIQSPVLRLSVWNIAITTGTVTLLFVFIISKGLLIQRKRPVTGLEGLIGAIGEVREDLAPEGLVFVQGELWKARSVDGQEIHRGERVIIVDVERGRLSVKKANGVAS